MRNFRFLQKRFAFGFLNRTVHDAMGLRRSTSQKTVLLVDDNSMVLEVLAHLLEASGLKVLCAATADDALMRLKEDAAVDVIVTDLMLPGVSGFDLIRKMRTIAPSLPVVAMTGELSRGVTLLEDAESMGIAATLVKPFSSDELVRVVQRCTTHE